MKIYETNGGRISAASEAARLGSYVSCLSTKVSSLSSIDWVDFRLGQACIHRRRNLLNSQVSKFIFTERGVDFGHHKGGCKFPLTGGVKFFGSKLIIGDDQLL